MRKRTLALLIGAVVLLGSVTALLADSAESAVNYTLSAEQVTPGESVTVTLGFDGVAGAMGYAVLLDDEGMGKFSDMAFTVEEVAESKALMFVADPEDANDVAAAYAGAVTLDGDYVKYTFTVPSDAALGTKITLNFTTRLLDKNNAVLAGSGTVAVTVYVGEAPAYVLGDIGGDGKVDISDALALFKYSMLSELYPVSYPGNMDFNHDGSLDISDALALFKYSMLPELYPLT